MENIFSVDWETMLVPDTPLLEIFLRGTFTYLGLFLLLRVVLKRESGSVGIADLLVVVLLADASQNAMADDYRSVTDGFLLVATIIFWDYMLNWMGYRFPRVQRLIRPPALLLVKDGQMLRKNMRKEFITEEELMSMMREQGVKTLDNVERAFMEGDGAISILTRDGSRQKEPDSGAQ